MTNGTLHQIWVCEVREVLVSGPATVKLLHRIDQIIQAKVSLLLIEAGHLGLNDTPKEEIILAPCTGMIHIPPLFLNEHINGTLFIAESQSMRFEVQHIIYQPKPKLGLTT
jgi:hypothetical protein